MIKLFEKNRSVQEDDTKVIQKIAQRDAAAFATFYDRTARTVFTFLSALLKNRVESEDLLQETFWQVWRHAAVYDPDMGTPPMVWVLTMAQGLGIDRLKHVQHDAGTENISIDLVFLTTLAPVIPPTSIRTNLLNAMEQEKNITPRFPPAPPAKQKSFLVRFPWPMAIGWSLAGVFGAIVFGNLNANWQEVSRQNAEIAAIHQTLSEKETGLNMLRIRLSEKEEALALIEARETVVLTLMGYPSSPNTLGKIFWNPERNAGFFFAFDLPPPPDGKVYQLWALQKGTSVDAGVFSFSEKTDSFKIKLIPNAIERVQFFTVTAEPVGGSQQPTGEILLRSRA